MTVLVKVCRTTRGGRRGNSWGLYRKGPEVSAVLLHTLQLAQGASCLGKFRVNSKLPYKTVAILVFKLLSWEMVG